MNLGLLTKYRGR